MCDCFRKKHGGIREKIWALFGNARTDFAIAGDPLHLPTQRVAIEGNAEAFAIEKIGYCRGG
ncbi:hypothetical protein TM239_66550 [Bradyrhizobium sp. TM239]|nr:hypothetical protein TM239_66550 [Bradyrhizobium sp. TM239]